MCPSVGIFLAWNTPTSHENLNADSQTIARNPNYSKFESLLSPGWIPGRKVDNSDAQYAGFRDNIPYLFIVMALQPLLRRLFDALYSSSGVTRKENHTFYPNGTSTTSSSTRHADDRLEQRISFDVIFNLLFLLALHGCSSPKVLLILYINYLLATKLQGAYVPIVTWTFNIGILFANELGKGYPYTTIANSVFPWASAEGREATSWSAYLDSYGGLIPRWEILFNVTVLRLISFNFDYHWARNRSGSNSPVEVSENTWHLGGTLY